MRIFKSILIGLLLAGCADGGAAVEAPLCRAPGKACATSADCCGSALCEDGTCRNSGCAATGEACSSTRGCCGDARCEAGVCSAGAGCAGAGAHCTASGDCCGNGQCDGGLCTPGGRP